MRKYLLIMMALLFSVSWSVMAVAQDQTLAEKLLIILKQNHQITPEQYNQLLEQAQQEKSRQKAAVAKQVKAQAAEEAKEYKKANPLGVTASWKNHEVFLETNNGEFTAHVGGYAEVDFGYSSANANLKKAFPTTQGYGDEARRARIEVDGTLYHDFTYMAMLDFSNGAGYPLTQDLWLTYVGCPQYANVRVGHMKMPFSLEELTSDQWLDFTERSLANSFVTENGHDYSTGVMLFDTEFNQRMTWAFGGYIQQTDNGSGKFFGDYTNTNIAARITALPLYEDDGCELLHLGLSYMHRFRSRNVPATAATYPDLIFTDFPEFHLDPSMVAAKMIADGADIIDPEFAFVYGPFSVQGEYMDAFVTDASTTSAKTTISSPNFGGYYVAAYYFLTGEHRIYNKGAGVFDRPKLNCNFNPWEGTWGAWELAARYSSLDLTDKTISGGRETNWTGSLIWYLNPNVRMLFDYIHAHVDGVSTSTAYNGYLQNGDANIFDSRIQFSF
ncbi:MAG: OprO/OprP family phosphate-selective porin [Syntrophobacteraceae bacterium]